MYQHKKTNGENKPIGPAKKNLVKLQVSVQAYLLFRVRPFWNLMVLALIPDTGLDPCMVKPQTRL